ncbi:cation-transporting P-type ATPase [Rhodosalinus halophilus]|uniref:Cation-transporting P-type ATPase n=1 Tax=Rhodosalinus halophilus TaxID=2259333 RepID=A0A365U4Y6_9RHOB|nr:cation-transporting P-type ATPase [Rhodosalinus halophilus]RBI83347.1 cation-transporting P-type ATPase [Rhodosalinus halophilus]
MERPHAQTCEEVCSTLQVDPARGLSQGAAAKRLRESGPNRLARARRAPAWRILVDQFRNLIVGVLLLAAMLSGVVGEMVQAAAILVALAINVGIGFYTELSATRSIEALRRLEEDVARVRRDGTERSLAAEKLVPGDVVLLQAGEIVPADLRICESSSLRIDESALTGESVPVGKTAEPVDADADLADRANLAFRGTSVSHGAGAGVVVATGMKTELGRIAELAESAESAQTPLQKQLDALSRRLLVVIAGVAALVAATGAIAGRDLLLMAETGIALVVAAVPEGLPIVASIALARGMWRLADRQALIEKLSAVETLGATNVICADKTGTLTRNRMTLDRLALDGGDVALDARDEAPGGALRAALEVGALCTSAELERDARDEPRGTGDPMELALLVAARRAGCDRADLLDRRPELRREEFDPETRMMATFHRADDAVLVAVKGAPEAVIDRCTHVMDAEGKRVALDEDGRADWHARTDAMAGKGLRALALARRTADDSDVEPYENLTLIGLAGLLDPPRPEVREAVRACRDAGIRVVMVTGDQPETARAIAGEVGILDDPEAAEVRLGSDMAPPEEMTDEALATLRETPVFARFDPAQKLALIEVYQDAGYVVAMTGDGVNDAPALKKADIGIAMGQRGTEVAREAADMVLRDDSFASIEAAVREGRTIFGNIRKFVLYMLSGNAGEILAVSLVALLNAPLPLLPLQILYINIVSDVFPALALGVGESRANVMQRPPRDPSEPILTRRLWGAIGGYGLLIGGSVLAVFWAAFQLGLTREEAVTVSFLAFGFARLWHVLNMRDPDTRLFDNEVLSNRYVWAAVGLGIALMLATIYVPVMRTVLETAVPGPQGWLLIAAGSLAPLFVGQLLKTRIARRALGSAPLG